MCLVDHHQWQREVKVRKNAEISNQFFLLWYMSKLWKIKGQNIGVPPEKKVTFQIKKLQPALPGVLRHFVKLQNLTTGGFITRINSATLVGCGQSKSFHLVPRSCTHFRKLTFPNSKSNTEQALWGKSAWGRSGVDWQKATWYYPGWPGGQSGCPASKSTGSCE
jgi:hypothetical protein